MLLYTNLFSVWPYMSCMGLLPSSGGNLRGCQPKKGSSRASGEFELCK